MIHEQQRKILEFAAKACEINRNDYVENGARNGSIVTGFYSNLLEEVWNPLTSPADCAEMCAELEINTLHWDDAVVCDTSFPHRVSAEVLLKDHDNSRIKAWMAAATMVAAKIGGYTE